MVVGRTEEDPGVRQRKVVVILGDAGRDPGYWSTARIVLEAGLGLALQQGEIRAQQGLPTGGVLTPATGLGDVLARRLKRAGYSVIVRGRHGLEYEE